MLINSANISHLPPFGHRFNTIQKSYKLLKQTEFLKHAFAFWEGGSSCVFFISRLRYHHIRFIGQTFSDLTNASLNYSAQ